MDASIVGCWGVNWICISVHPRYNARASCAAWLRIELEPNFYLGTPFSGAKVAFPADSPQKKNERTDVNPAAYDTNKSPKKTFLEVHSTPPADIQPRIKEFAPAHVSVRTRLS